MKKIMIIGTGILGAHVVDMLLRMGSEQQIIVAGRDLLKVQERVNLAEQVALNLGFHPNVHSTKIDLWNVDQTAETLSALKPEIIFNATSLMSWWIPTTLPSTISQELVKANSGWRLPMHLTLLKRLMTAVKQAGLQTRIVNAAYPDATHRVLSTIGLSPEVGIGNVGNIIPVLRKAVSFLLQVAIDRVEVRVIGHHHFSFRIPSQGNDLGLPYAMSILLDGRDITQELNRDEVFRLLPTQFKRTRGLLGQANTAAAAMSVLMEMANPTGKVIHAPGPNGLIGGYPIRIDADGTAVVLPAEVSLEEAIEINAEGQRMDGIEQIDDDGTVYFTEEHMAIVKNMLGYECYRMQVSEIEDRAKELQTRYTEFVNQLHTVGV